MTTTKLNDDMIRELAVITTRDDAGRHFTEWSRFTEELEELGLIEVHRPVHAATGMAYGCEHWTVQITPDGESVVGNNPELQPRPAVEYHGDGYSVRCEDGQFTLIHPVNEDEVFDSFEELVESHPVCEKSRSFFF